MFKTLRQLCIFGCFILLAKASYSQSFFKDYKRYSLSLPHYKLKTLNRSVKNMQKAFNAYQNQTHINLLNNDTLFMVQYYNIESAEHTYVVWSDTFSFYYRYSFNRALELHNDASEWIKNYKPEFKKWVETADTLSYSKYGRQESWLDAPSINFIVATKKKSGWHFITSGAYFNNVDRLD